MTVNIVTGSVLKGLREAGCRITTICKCKGYKTKYFGVDVIRVRTSGAIDTNFVSILLTFFADFLVHTVKLKPIIGERSELLSDKLGGEICIATRALVCIYICVRTA